MPVPAFTTPCYLSILHLVRLQECRLEMLSLTAVPTMLSLTAVRIMLSLTAVLTMLSLTAVLTMLSLTAVLTMLKDRLSPSLFHDVICAPDLLRAQVEVYFN